MQDRLADLLKEELQNFSNNSSENGIEENAIRSSFDQMSIIQSNLDSIKMTIEEIKVGYSKSLFISNISKIEDANAQNEKKIEQLANTSLQLLRKFNQETQKLTSKYEIGFRTQLHNHKMKKLQELLITFRDVQSDYKEKCKDRLRLRARVVRPNATDTEIKDLVESGKIDYAREILGERQKLSIESLHYVEKRHQDILRIEENIRELNSLFQDISLLVQAQGEMIDNIEANIDATVHFVEGGKENLVDANKKAKKSRKVLISHKKLLILQKIWIILGMVLVVVIVGAVLLSL